MNGSPHLCGVPTSPDVERLVKHFGKPVEGTKVPYAEITKVIATTERSRRWWSIVGAWRRWLRRECNYILEAFPKEAFEVLVPGRTLTHVAKANKNRLRGIRRDTEVIIRLDPQRLTPEEVRQRDHIGRTYTAIEMAVRTEARAQSYTLPEVQKAIAAPVP